MRLLALAAISWLLLCTGCGGEPPSASSTGSQSWLSQALQSQEFLEACKQTPGCAQQEVSRHETEPVWRVRISLDEEKTYRIEEVEKIAVVKGDGVPVGAIYSAVALVGLDPDGKVVDGQLLRFPRAPEEHPADQIDLHPAISASRLSAYGYLRALPIVERLAVQNSEGETLDSQIIPPDLEPAIAEKILGWLGVETAWAMTRPFIHLSPTCAHIIVLQGEEDRHLAEGNVWGEGIRLITPGPYQLASMSAALGRMTPLLCQSIGRIGVGNLPLLPNGSLNNTLGAVKSTRAGDLIMLNARSKISEDRVRAFTRYRWEFQKTLIHEAGHAAETLLTFESDNPGEYIGSWGFPSRTLADKTIGNVRLAVGLPREWKRLHHSFRLYGWAEQFGQFSFPTDGSAPEWTGSELVRGGFMSQYSSQSWAEDIADFVGMAYMGRYAEPYGMSRADAACIIMQRHQEENLPAEWSAVYSKLYFLLDLGLVRKEDVEWCTGGRIGLHVDQPGFHSWRGGEKKRSYLDGVEARLGTLSNGMRVFELDAKGQAEFGEKTYPAALHLRLAVGRPSTALDQVSWPRGTYALGLGSDNRFWTRLEGGHAGNFDAMDGFVVVVESSGEHIVGSIVIRKAMRMQLKPLPLPEIFDPPLVFRFRVDGSGS